VGVLVEVAVGLGVGVSVGEGVGVDVGVSVGQTVEDVLGSARLTTSAAASAEADLLTKAGSTISLLLQATNKHKPIVKIEHWTSCWGTSNTFSLISRMTNLLQSRINY
jgi:hypothetical protein